MTDAKWRFVASQTGAKVGEVVAVWACMMEHANKAEPRGTLAGWRDKVYAMLLDLDPSTVTKIREEMQGLTLDGELLTSWSKRQPTSTERVRRHREMKRSETRETHETPREDKNREEEITTSSSSTGATDENIDKVIRAANRGIIENPALAGADPIREGHGSRQNVYDWLNQGVPLELACSAVYERARQYEPGPGSRQPRSMAYFAGVVMDAWEKHKAAATEVPNGNGSRKRPDGPVRTGGQTPAKAGGDRGQVFEIE